MTRGDIFKKNWVKTILSSFFLIPVHRLSEGKENMVGNDKSFSRCIELFAEGEVVLIFSEGICTYQTKLLPLKKGTARLAQKAQMEGINLKVIPITVTYNTFSNFCMVVNLNIGTDVMNNELASTEDDAIFLKRFNEVLAQELNKLLNYDFAKVSFWQSPLYSMLYVSHFPAVHLALFASRNITQRTVFYHSVAVGLMLIILPIYWLILLNVFVF